MKRLGGVLYRAGLLLGLLIAAVIARVASLEPAGLTWADLALAVAAFMILYFVGVACRYVLSGE